MNDTDNTTQDMVIKYYFLSPVHRMNNHVIHKQNPHTQAGNIFVEK